HTGQRDRQVLETAQAARRLGQAVLALSSPAHCLRVERRDADRVIGHERPYVSAMTFREFERLCLALPEAELRETWGEATFRVRDRIFAIGSFGGAHVSVKASLDDQSGLMAMDPETFELAA